MATLGDRTGTAVLVVDVQRGVVDEAVHRDEVVGAIGGLVERARQASVPVVWVQHSDEEMPVGSDPWQIVPELAPAAGEPRVGKEYGDAFEDTTLEAELAQLGVGRLVVTGAESDACIRCTLRGALTRGYDALLVSDAHTTGDKSAWGAPPPDDVVAFTNLYWRFTRAPGRTGGIATAAEVELG